MTYCYICCGEKRFVKQYDPNLKIYIKSEEDCYKCNDTGKIKTNCTHCTRGLKMTEKFQKCSSCIGIKKIYNHNGCWECCNGKQSYYVNEWCSHCNGSGYI